MRFEKDYLLLEENDKIYSTKIFSSRYPTLLGVNDFQKQGDAMLEMWKLIPKEPFDPFYTIRGEVAEIKVQELLESKGIKYKHYGSETSKQKIFDLFVQNKFFGGVYDFLATDSNGKMVSIEVKSTNIKNKPFINEAKKEHIKQAELACFLGKISRCKIIYVFFDDENEAKIKQLAENYTKQDIDLIECEMKTFNVEINEAKIQTDMMIAYDLVNECKKNRRIPIALLSNKTLDFLGYKANIFEREEIIL